MHANGLRVTRASPAGNAAKTGVSRPEKSAVAGINCRGKGAIRGTKERCFIGFFAMARRLLILA
jgi:hypothetical protein